MELKNDYTKEKINILEDDIRLEKKNGIETYIFDPYNSLNKLITKEEINNILKNYGINLEINNMNLYKRAFIHRSYVKKPYLENIKNNIKIYPKPENCLPLFTKSNERLEFIGDGLLECITKFYLYKRFPKENEGFMTEKKIALVKNEAIGKIALEIGLHKWLIISNHAEIKQTRINLKKLGCLFEAFIAAIFLDFNKILIDDEESIFKNTFSSGIGFQIVQLFVENVFEKHVNWTDLIINDENYKNILQVKIQKEFKTTPTYIDMNKYEDEKNKHQNDNYFHMGVFLCLGDIKPDLINMVSYKDFNNFQLIHNYVLTNNKIFLFLGEGKHKIKKKAEQIACEEAIKNISKF